jgi:flagellar basal-body rod protein FlgG
MQNGYYQATGGMVTQFNRLNTITNNLANVNTSGYKKDDVVVGDFMRLFQEARENLPLANHTKEGAKFLNRTLDRVPQVVEGYTDFSIGMIKKTENPFDFSLKQGDLFFKVQTPNGTRLTQSGAFNLDQEGNIVTKEGFVVLNDANEAINVSKNTRLTSTNDGTLYADNRKIGKLAIIQVENLKALKKDGNNTFLANEEEIAQVQNGGDYILQGHLEKSNINPVNEMVALIETNRLVEMYQKVMDSQMNDMNRDAITKLGSVQA